MLNYQRVRATRNMFHNLRESTCCNYIYIYIYVQGQMLNLVLASWLVIELTALNVILTSAEIAEPALRILKFRWMKLSKPCVELPYSQA